MTRILLATCFFLLQSLFTMAQEDVQFTIQIGREIITVSKIAGGKEMLVFSIHSWDEYMAGTRYVSSNLSFNKARKCCIEIADKKKGLCIAGIGFGCSIFDCRQEIPQHIKIVNNRDRVCAVSIMKIKGAVRMIFIDKVDWNSLRKGY